ncbi:MAG TPA: low molecular weight phosphotyrosine protein phosphatase [Candidatus Ornithospirochaeta avicola]|uniref:protein-tyrosine-phosphatase n=1 Tax=Candidatus Ornithospirochaeta avicola TaxID=2840896 RepID=A0A9D1PTB7_9SPIO|nr:low molecular weight phosphotyrosine protein phosphatase [Candidatus Ornithospirochaeta avicola]
MIKILFVCHGNICRSAMAECMAKDFAAKNNVSELFYFDSAATSKEEIGNRIYPPAREKLKDMNIAVCDHKARQITKQDIKEFDYIYYMDDKNKRNIIRLFGFLPDNTRPLLENKDIADPWYTGNFEQTYNDIKRGLENMFENLR